MILKSRGPNNRVGCDANTTIFDVWSDGVYDDLLEQGLSSEIGIRLVAQCKDANRIFGFIAKRSKEDSDIAEVVAGKLTEVLGN
jgi:hypothetical protein